MSTRKIADTLTALNDMTNGNNLVWVTGANGLIGNYFVQTAPQFAPHKKIRGLTRNDFDLLDFAAVEREFKKDQPQGMIHCAAISTIAGAEKNPGLAKTVNVGTTKFLAGLASEIPFVLLSTDLVFDGRKGNYSETDTTNPLHIYGETKLAAEEIVLRNPRHLIVRTSINGGVSPAGNRGFNEQLRSALKNSSGMKLFTDEFRCPIPAIETVRAIWELLEKNCAGIFHVAGAEKLSRWQIGRLLVKRWPEIKTQIQSGSAKDFPGPPRALDTSLDISKAQKVLSKPLPGLSDWLATNPQENF
ncbi:MAG TPA: SDR family oxidoreductase [Verrucomicrobiae bacterium]|nr:SDR family oxidoreductase [Verrucomicrobiae bacterium]